MMIWNNFKVRTKLGVLIALATLTLIVVASLGVYGIRDTAGSLDENTDSLKQVAIADQLVKNFLTVRLDVVYMMLLTDPGKVEEKYADLTKRVAMIRDDIKKITDTSLKPEEAELLKTFSGGFDSYLVQGEKLAKLAQESARNGGKDHEAIIAFATESVAPLYAKPAEAIASMVDNNLREATAMAAEDKARSTKISTAMITIGIICIAGLLLISALIVRSITGPLQQILEVLSQVADGNLTARCTIASKDEMGLLAQEATRMTGQLAGVVNHLAVTSHDVSAAAIQMNATAKQMAIAAEELSAQAGTVATASHEMSATSDSIASSCLVVAHDAGKANETALSGSEVVNNTVTVMERIAERVRATATTVETLGHRSDQIGDIVGTIEDIADQTNLLALNAAIEAARAGEQGRGFAVVADEVRALAERTTRATREIGDMIKAIQNDTRGAVQAMEEGVREVENGTVEASRSGEALRHILDQVGSVTLQANQIATAAEEQTATTNDITSNISMMSEVVEQAANGSQETAAAANELARLAEDLKEMVGNFRTH
jgi:methyl-accepting chemotaxis protein